VAKGAFAAGALSYLALRLRTDRVPIRALVGTSSGALNATVLASGVRAGRAISAAKALVRLWRDEGGLSSVLDLDVGSAVRFGGLSGPGRLLRLLDAACERAGRGPRREPVSLRVVVAPLAGTPGERTSFEAVERFHDAELDDPARRERMLRAAVASAAFPFAFTPVEVDGLGPCIDGGIVNNTPIGEAIERDPGIATVYVVVAEPADLSLPIPRAARLRGIDLGARLVEMAVDERLVRDLAEARAVNAWLDTLDRLEASGELSAAARRDVIEGLYRRDAARFRRLEIVEIRPRTPLQGSAFDGFFRPALRRAYLRAGWDAAREACGAR
jgi:NTE family protein